ncbi:MauE/DoxX family redox-associated membrane protein [Flavobacterium sp. UW10123]|uniref:MauE/DoxX family redox-associated membrane protein n=1 Tax=Flavobacterium sp. UW10123 TaxID=3230800 RepID=UPI003392DB7E
MKLLQMKFSVKFLSITEEIICFSLIVLFVYASMSKILDYENFRVELGQSPVLSAYAGAAAPSVLIAELLTALFLAWKPCRKFALLASFILMAMFTCYIIIILNFSDYIPCSCGGVLQRLGWRDHIIFNIVFVIISGTGFFIIENKKYKNSTKTFTV